TLLFAAVVSKPKPLMTKVVAFAARFALLDVTTGVTVATCTAAPLLTPFTLTIAVSGPAVVGVVEKVTVSCVAVAFVTVPTAPSLKTTVLLAAVVEKPLPSIVTVVALNGRLAVLDVTLGGLTMVAT